jgi:cytochrome c biogenesis protein CcmG/thiol:disulfide interchange protein DsbE
MKRSVFGKLAAFTCMLFLLGACAQGGAVEQGSAAPDISLTDTKGAPVKLSDHKGEVVILNFFATWCPPCRGEIPDFIRLKEEYGTKGFTVIGVSNEDASDVEGFVENKNINYPVWIDASGSAFNAYGPIRGVPTTFIIGRDFKVKKKYIGARPGSVFEEDIKELL